jgi:hypothetical protein
VMHGPATSLPVSNKVGVHDPQIGHMGYRGHPWAGRVDHCEDLWSLSNCSVRSLREVPFFWAFVCLVTHSLYIGLSPFFPLRIALCGIPHVWTNCFKTKHHTSLLSPLGQRRGLSALDVLKLQDAQPGREWTHQKWERERERYPIDNAFSPEVHFFLLLVNRPTKNLDRTIKDGDEASIFTGEEQRFNALRKWTAQ